MCGVVGDGGFEFFEVVVEVGILEVVVEGECVVGVLYGVVGGVGEIG